MSASQGQDRPQLNMCVKLNTDRLRAFETDAALFPGMPVCRDTATSHNPSAVPALTVTEAGQTENAPSTPSPIEYLSPVENEDQRTSLALRDHDPLSVYSQNQQLSPKRNEGHSRSPSGASLASMASTVPDDGTVVASSAPASPTPLRKRSLDLESGLSRENKPQSKQKSASSRPAATKASKKGVLGTLMFWRKAEIEESGADSEAEEEQDPNLKIPDPSPQAMGKFTIKPSQLDNLFNPKSQENLDALGGVEGVAKHLFTSTKNGLDAHGGGDQGTTLEQRLSAYGANQLPQRKSKSLLRLMWIAFQDKVLIILSIAAVVSLALGIYQTVGTPPEVVNGEKQPHVEWVEGVVCVFCLYFHCLKRDNFSQQANASVTRRLLWSPSSSS